MNEEQDTKLRDAMAQARERQRRAWQREPDEDAVLMEAMRETLGEEQALLEPRYYGAWARRIGRDLEEIMDGEFGPEFGHDLVLAVSAFTDVGKDEPELMLRKLADVRAALERLEARRRGMEVQMMRRLNVVRDMSHSFIASIKMLEKIRENVGG